ncbi:hypothetical protein [Hyphomicrobium sp. CS1GBMeth3]|uniref:hypothetical protein n=1 Tax=Hyphomicrobium sp. CS1GBMeth3 TaxID=1892845 RepID=UPI000931413A|nr:hypothetical protein [Hyphomicrobium sp. CS1GBMeth3]
MANGSYGMLAGAVALSMLALSQPAHALTMQECSAKYKAAQEAGAASSISWNDFRKKECGADATMALKPVKKAPSEAAATGGPSIEECSVRYKAAKAGDTLGGQSWNDFRKGGCVAQAAPPQAKTLAHEAKTVTHGAATKPGASDTETVSQRECSARYQDAKTTGQLGGMTWNEFRHAGCPQAVTGTHAALLSNAVFPSGVSKKYAGEAAGRARLLTCRDQYEANKAAGRAELKWSEEGGGYYSECNKRLSQN